MLIKSICIVTLIVSLALMSYFIYNAFQTSKRNRAQSEANSRIFIAQIEKELQEKGLNGVNVMDGTKNYVQKVQKTAPKSQLIITPDIPKPLNYDEYTDDVDLNAANGKTLKDFFDV